MNYSSMSYEDFKEAMLTALRLFLPDDGTCEIRVKPVIRNNQVTSETLTIIGEGRCCAPVIHLSEIYDCYLAGTDVPDLAEHIADIYDSSADHFSDLTSDLLFDFDYVKDRIILKLVNYERNREMLEDVPHIRKLDLALTFRLFAVTEDRMAGSILVDRMLMEMWGCTPQSLLELASENMNRMWRPVLLPMDCVVRDFMEEAGEISVDRLKSPLIVMTNEKFCMGAVSLFCSDQLKELARHTKCDYYVLPSSIHEVILLPCTEEMTAGGLEEMVRNVNADVVSEEDFLSDHIYIYEREKDRLRIAGEETYGGADFIE